MARKDAPLGSHYAHAMPTTPALAYVDVCKATDM